MLLDNFIPVNVSAPNVLLDLIDVCVTVSFCLVLFQQMLKKVND